MGSSWPLLDHLGGQGEPSQQASAAGVVSDTQHGPTHVECGRPQKSPGAGLAGSCLSGSGLPGSDLPRPSLPGSDLLGSDIHFGRYFFLGIEPMRVELEKKTSMAGVSRVGARTQLQPTGRGDTQGFNSSSPAQDLLKL